jgi:hypothetical protein
MRRSFLLEHVFTYNEMGRVHIYKLYEECETRTICCITQCNASCMRILCICVMSVEKNVIAVLHHVLKSVYYFRSCMTKGYS